MTASLSAGDLLGMFLHFMLLSLIGIGGAIAAAPDMQRYMVTEHHWLSDSQFTASIALAQAAPGPNVLFVAVLGWNVAGAWGALATLTGILLPSTLLNLAVTRWGHARRETLGVRAFKAGMAPLTIGLLLSTGWILAGPTRLHPGATLLVSATVITMLATRISPLWAIGVGALVGGFGFA